MLEMINAPDKEDAPATDIATLPPADRAALVLNSAKTEADLKQLATSLKAITMVNSPAGREQAHALAMTARTARTGIEKAGKAARDDATKFSKAVIAEEDRLIEIIQPEETRVLGLRNAWDAAEAARKEAELQKERDRIAAHQAVIERIKVLPVLAREARTSAMAIEMLNKLEAIEIDGLEEFKDAAHAAMQAAEEMILRIIDVKQTHEREQARIKAEQEAEAARLAEQAHIQALQQAELLAMQAKIKAQQEELERCAAEMAQQVAELEARKAEAEKPAEAPTAVLADEPREALGQIIPQAMASQLVPAALVQMPVPADFDIAITPAPSAAEVANATRSVIEAIGFSISHGQAIPTAVDLANTIAFAQGVPFAKAIEWLAHRADDFKNLHL